MFSLNKVTGAPRPLVNSWRPLVSFDEKKWIEYFFNKRGKTIYFSRGFATISWSPFWKVKYLGKEATVTDVKLRANHIHAYFHQTCHSFYSFQTVNMSFLRHLAQRRSGGTRNILHVGPFQGELELRSWDCLHVNTHFLEFTVQKQNEMRNCERLVLFTDTT